MDQLSRNLILLHKGNTNPKHLAEEVNWLNQQLVCLEKSNYFTDAHEILHINKRKVYTDKKTINKIMHQPTLKAFVFIHNKN